MLMAAEGGFRFQVSRLQKSNVMLDGKCLKFKQRLTKSKVHSRKEER